MTPLKITRCALAAALLPLATFADSVNSPNITLNVDTNRAVGNGAGNVAVNINTITLAEITLPEYSAGGGQTFSLRVRPGFQFDPSSNVTAQSATIGFNGFAINTAVAITPAGVPDEVLTFILTSGTDVNVQDIIRINGIRLKILSAEGAAGPAQSTIALTTSTAGGAFANQGIVAANIAKGAPDHLAFTTQPGDQTSGAALLPAVAVQDFGNNLLQNVNVNISLAIQDNPAAGALTGVLQRATSNGVATWLDTDLLAIAAAGAGYTLRASHDGAAFLTSDTVDSAPFVILAGPPDRMVVVTQPIDTAAGAPILLDVEVRDASNNLVGDGVEVTIDAAVNPGGWPLLVDSSLTKQTVGGRVSWAAADRLRINKVIDDYRLILSGVGNPVVTDAFDIIAAAPRQLRFVQQPSPVVEATAVAPPVTVRIEDEFGNPTDAAVEVTLALSTNPCGGGLSGGTATSVTGLATFDALTFDTPCTDNQLSASAAGLIGEDSDAFDVLAAPVDNQNDNSGDNENANENENVNENAADNVNDNIDDGADPANLCGPCGPGAVATFAPVVGMAWLMRRRFRRA